MKKKLIFIGIRKALFVVALCIVVMTGCSSEKLEEKEEWTYERLEKEFGKIIETDFSSTQKCLEIIEKSEFKICGTIIEKRKASAFGIDLWYLGITDDKDNSYSGNTVDVTVTEYAFSNVSEGEFIYAVGTANYIDYGIKGIENNVTFSCDNGGSIYTQEIEGSTSVKEYINAVKKISEDTYFQTKGLVIQDGDNYKLYESKESYNENNREYIQLEFLEEQSDLNGNVVTVMGKPDTYLNNGLIQCNVIKE